MPSRRLRASWAAMFLVAASATAAVDAPVSSVQNSELDASLFYEILLGEIQVRQGELGGGYQQLLSAARRTRSEPLFRRAVGVALAAPAPDLALAAAQSWRRALPRSREAAEILGRLQLAQHQDSDATTTLQDWLALTPAAQLPESLSSLPRFATPGADAAVISRLTQRLTDKYVNASDSAVKAAAWSARGQAALSAGEADAAMTAARESLKSDPTDLGAALLAVDLLNRPGAEDLVQQHLTAQPESPARMVYVRRLVDAQRYGHAIAQLEILTRQDPNRAPAWLMLGALQVDMRQPREAESSLKRYLQLLPPPAPAASAPVAADSDEEGASEGSAVELGRTQAYLLLAQLAEQRKDSRAADEWLSRIVDPRQALAVQTRRAQALAREGKVAEARDLLRQVPERQPGDARAKLLAELQLLRERKLWKDAYLLLDQATKAQPEDADLLYEKAMIVDRLGQPGEMERLLREVMRLKPNEHHAYNALGYSLADRNERLDEAHALVTRALALAPGDPFITDSLGWVEFRRGRRREALLLLRQAWSARADTEIGAHLGEVLWSGGQKDEARQIWRQARQRDADNEVLRETLARLRVDL